MGAVKLSLVSGKNLDGHSPAPGTPASGASCPVQHTCVTLNASEVGLGLPVAMAQAPAALCYLVHGERKYISAFGALASSSKALRISTRISTSKCYTPFIQRLYGSLDSLGRM